MFKSYHSTAKLFNRVAQVVNILRAKCMSKSVYCLLVTSTKPFTKDSALEFLTPRISNALSNFSSSGFCSEQRCLTSRSLNTNRFPPLPTGACNLIETSIRNLQESSHNHRRSALKLPFTRPPTRSSLARGHLSQSHFEIHLNFFPASYSPTTSDPNNRT